MTEDDIDCSIHLLKILRCILVKRFYQVVKSELPNIAGIINFHLTMAAAFVDTSLNPPHTMKALTAF